MIRMRFMAEDKIEQMLDSCDSPIERRLVLAIAAHWTDRHRGALLFLPRGAQDFQTICPDGNDAPLTLAVVPQAPVRYPQFRARHDFLLRAYKVAYSDIDKVEPDALLVVECDGHAFHERTPEQAERDRRRDRAAQALGRPIFRFTGSEITRDHYGCARELTDYIGRALELEP